MLGNPTRDDEKKYARAHKLHSNDDITGTRPKSRTANGNVSLLSRLSHGCCGPPFRGGSSEGVPAIVEADVYMPYGLDGPIRVAREWNGLTERPATVNVGLELRWKQRDT